MFYLQFLSRRHATVSWDIIFGLMLLHTHTYETDMFSSIPHKTDKQMYFPKMSNCLNCVYLTPQTVVQMYQSLIKHVFLTTSPISNIYCDISFLFFTPDTRYFMNTNFSLDMNTYIETSMQQIMSYIATFSVNLENPRLRLCVFQSHIPTVLGI